MDVCFPSAFGNSFMQSGFSGWSFILLRGVKSKFREEVKTHVTGIKENLIKTSVYFDEKKISNRLKILSPNVVLKNAGIKKSKIKAATLGWKSWKNGTNFFCAASYSYRKVQIKAFGHWGNAGFHIALHNTGITVGALELSFVEPGFQPVSHNFLGQNGKMTLPHYTSCEAYTQLSVIPIFLICLLIF